MAFFSDKETELPVFDTPPERGSNAGFTMHRVVTAAGRSFLTEKNLPVQPATDKLFKKCYSAKGLLLYKLELALFVKTSPKVFHRFEEENQEYEIPKKYFLPNKRLIYNSPPKTIIRECSFLISSVKSLLFNEINRERKPFKSFTDFSEIPLDNYIKYQNYEFRFDFKMDIKRISSAHIKNTSKTDIINSRVNPNLLSLSVKTCQQSFTSELFQTCLYDFSNYYEYLDDECHQLYYIKTYLKPFTFPVIQKSTNNNDYSKSPITDRIVSEFPYNSLKEKLDFFENDYFGPFYLVCKYKLPVLEPDAKRGKAQSSYILDLPRALNVKDSSKFAFLPYSEKSYFVNKRKAFSYNRMLCGFLPDSSLEIKEVIYNKSYVATANKILISFTSKTIKTTKQYKQLRMALKLKIRKPGFQSKTELSRKIQVPRIIKQKLCYPNSRFIQASFLPFVIKSKNNQTLDTTIRNDLFTAFYKLKERALKFINKCPKHGLYTVRALRKILCSVSFRKSRKIKHDFKAFKEPHLNKLLCKDTKFHSILDLAIPAKVLYSDRIVSDTIRANKESFTEILTSSRMNRIERVKSVVGFFDARSKTGKNSLKALRIIKGKITRYEKHYHQAYINPLKRIKPVRQNFLPLTKGYSLLSNKVADEIYSKNNPCLDIFRIKFVLSECNYAEYLPKQITDAFTLSFKIKPVPIVTSLSQNRIIPPPGWSKKTKDFTCKLRLGPYPFGFPNFFYAPPVFVQLVSRKPYGIFALTAEKVIKEHEFILSKTRLYLPELSMKGPRRLLHSELTTKNQPKEYYETDIEEAAPKQNQPKAIPSFSQSWEKVPLWRCHTEMSFKMQKKPRGKRIRLDINSFSSISYGIEESFLNQLKYRGMPKVTGFLIRSKQFVLVSNQGSILLNPARQKDAYNFEEKIPEFPSKTIFSDKKYSTKIVEEKTYLLPQNFSSKFPLKKAIQKFVARFRDFRFPYVPETNYALQNTEKFDFTEEYNSDCNCRFQDDFRVSQHDFEQAEIKSDFNKSFHFINKTGNSFQKSFIVDPQKLISEFNPKYIKPVFCKASLKKTEPPANYQHKIYQRFFKVNQRHSYKYMMRDKNRLAFSFSQITSHIDDSYSFFGLKDFCPNRLETTAYHWVILLRANKTAKKSDLFWCSEFIKTNTIISSYAFSLDFSYQEEAISKTEAKLPKELIQPNYDFSLINVLCQNIDEVIAYKLGISHINNNNPKDFTFYDGIKATKKKDYKPIKDLSFKDNISCSKNLSIKETSNLLRKTAKGIIKIPPFVLIGAKSNFAYLRSPDKKIDYRPIYLPVFIELEYSKQKFTVK